MNESDRVLPVLEPPPGGLARLLARRDSQLRAGPQWWALAAGAAVAVIWTATLPVQTEVRMQFSGARLIGERSLGVSAPVFEHGRAVPLPSSDANVRIYRVEPTEAAAPAIK